MNRDDILERISVTLADMGVMKRGDRAGLEGESTVFLDINGQFTTMNLYALLALLDTVKNAHGESL